MQPGQFLVNNKNGDKRMVLEVLKNLVAVGWLIGSEDEKNFHSWHSKKELEKNSWSLLEEPWKPTLSEPYWYVSEDGNFGITNWGKDGMGEHDFRYSIGNVHQNLSEAKLYKQKLIERMGRKE